MYYIKTIEDRVRLPPTAFSSRLDDALLHILKEQFEGRFFKDIGIVLLVKNPQALDDGIIIPGDSGAYYSVRFDALTFMPYVNEVHNAEIAEIVEFGAFATIGPIQGLLHISQISKEKFFYDKKGKSLTSKEMRASIKKGDDVIAKVSTVSMKPTITETKIGLTMRSDGLGKSEWIEERKKKAEKEKK